MVTAPLNLTEVLCALSLATDLANGNSLETTLRTCVLAVELAREAGLGEEERSDVFYAALLRYVGCTAFAPEEAAFAGDDLAFKRLYAPVDPTQRAKLLSTTVRELGAGTGVVARAKAVTRTLTQPALRERLASAGCEVGRRLAERLGMSAAVVTALDEIHERWDGRGVPARLEGTAISRVARVVHVAVTAELLHRTHGLENARRELRRRSGGQLDPGLVATFTREADAAFACIAEPSAWTAALERAPARQPSSDLSSVAMAFADFVDLKSAFTLGHSPRVAELSERTGAACGLGGDELQRLRHAALLHDLGRVGVPTGIWDKPGALNPAEWDRVHLHAHDTGRILGRSPALAQIGALAASHHERLDGSGYPRRAVAVQLGTSARILAAADAYAALTAERPHRPAMSPDRAAATLKSDAKEGRLDRRAVRALLDGVEGRRPRRSALWPAGLTDREVQVLGRLVRGESNKEIAAHFGLSPRTVQHHAIRVYGKIGVTSRAAAALYALENDLLEASAGFGP